MVSTDAALVRLLVTSTLSPDDLGAGRSVGAARLAALEGRLATSSPRPARSSGSRSAARWPRHRAERSRWPVVATAAMSPDFAIGSDRPDGDGRHRRRRRQRGGRHRPSARPRSSANTSRWSPTDRSAASSGSGAMRSPSSPSSSELRRNIVLVTLSAGPRGGPDPVFRLPLRPVADHPPGRGARRREPARHVDRDVSTTGPWSTLVAVAVERARGGRTARSASPSSTSTTSAS